MPILTFVARVSDGMLLAASMENAGEYGQNLDSYKSQAKQLIKKLTPRSPAKCSIESGSFCFHYMLQQDVLYLTMSDRSYPKRLAFLFLEEIHQAFIQELERDYGDQWKMQVDTVARPYAFIKFDKVIQKKRKEYANPQSHQNMNKLNDNLQDVQNIMRQNIQEVLSRGERIDDVSRMSSNLADRSKDFKWGAKKLSLQAMYRQYGPVAAAVFLVLFVIYIKFF